MARKRGTLTIALAIALIGLTALPVSVSPASVIKFKIHAGGFGYEHIKKPKLNDVDINGADQLTTGSLGLFSFIDARGTGAGWEFTAQATDFASDDGEGNLISAAGFRVPNAPAVTVIAGNTAPQAFGGPLNAPIDLMVATPGTGMGTFEVEPLLELDIPAETLAGSYESTLTLTLSAGF